MNQTQINDFLRCLSLIDDVNYLALHSRAASIGRLSAATLVNAAAVPKVSLEAGGTFHDDHDHDDSSSSKDLLIAKLTAMVVLFFATTICGAIPFLLNRCFKWTDDYANARSATVVKCLLYFGGGVLLCTTFLHLLPEVQEAVESLQECGTLPELRFAFAELLMCSGFFLMYFIQELIHAYVHRNKRLLEKDAGAGAAFQRGHSGRNSFFVRGSIKNDLHRADLTATAPEECDTVSTISTGPNNSATEKYQAAKSAKSISDQIEPQQHCHDHYHHNHHNHGHSHLPPEHIENGVLTSSLRGLFIVLALSLHELFEGMAIGLEGSASSVWFMFGAVSAHKLVLAFCVGVELIVARTRGALSIVYVLTFAIVSPIGIGVGILISHNKEATVQSVPSAVLQGLACGTLLYVVFFEILSKNNSGLIAYLALIVGFLIMFGLQQLGTDEHGHSHGQCEKAHTDGVGLEILSVPSAAGGGVYKHRDGADAGELGPKLLSYSSSGELKSSNFSEQLQILRQASQNIPQLSKKTD